MAARLRNMHPLVTRIADAFFYPLTSSHYLELVNPLWSRQLLQARIVATIPETPCSKTLVLRPGRGWRPHRAGQHVRVGVSLEGKRFIRTYSISSAPERDDGLFTITVKALGLVSQHLVHRARIGDYLPIGLPQGDFTLPEAMPVRPLLITAGSGVTPVAAMLRSLAAQGLMPDCTHLHFERTPAEVMFGKEIHQLSRELPQYKLHNIYTQKAGGGSGAHFSAAQLLGLCPDWRDRDAWVCGPADLLAATSALWEHAGLGTRLHQERFRAARAALDANATGGIASFRVSQKSQVADGVTPLLAVAEAAGLNPPHGCRMGICHGCDAVIHQGQVRDLRTGAMIKCEAGQRIQLCVTAAAGDLDLEL